MAGQLPINFTPRLPNLIGSPAHKPFDSTDAPPGYFAVPKADVPHDKGNLCRFCDWRPKCQRSSDEDDRLCEKYPCAGYEVINRDGQTLGRPDKTSVVFKRLLVR
jgi:hypothetical protein